MTDQDFGAAMAGDTIEKATSALLDEILIANMFRDPKKGKLAKPVDFNPYLTKNQPIVKAEMCI